MTQIQNEKRGDKDHKSHHSKPKPHEKPHHKPHEKKPQPKGTGVDMSGLPEWLLQKVFVHPDQVDWAENQIKHEGPDHKQVHSALLLKTTSRLLQEVERLTGRRFDLQPGEKVVSSKHSDTDSLPVSIPAMALSGVKKAEVLETLSGAPPHELVVFSTVLQALVWAINTLSEQDTPA